jgi:hypothetical protein
MLCCCRFGLVIVYLYVFLYERLYPKTTSCSVRRIACLYTKREPITVIVIIIIIIIIIVVVVR